MAVFDGAACDLLASLVATRACLANHNWTSCFGDTANGRSAPSLDLPLCLLFGLLDGIVGHALQTGNKAPTRGEVEDPIEATRPRANRVVLGPSHEDQQGNLEALAVCTGLFRVPSLARTAHVEMLWL